MKKIDFENGLPFGNNQQFTFHRRKFVSFCGLIFQNGKSTNITVTSITDNGFVVSEITKKLAIRNNTVLFGSLTNLNSTNSFFPPETVFKENFCGDAVLGVTRFLRNQRILDHNEQYRIMKSFSKTTRLSHTSDLHAEFGICAAGHVRFAAPSNQYCSYGSRRSYPVRSIRR